jgi:hypothetical protein
LQAPSMSVTMQSLLTIPSTSRRSLRRSEEYRKPIPVTIPHVPVLMAFAENTFYRIILLECLAYLGALPYKVTGHKRLGSSSRLSRDYVSSTFFSCVVLRTSLGTSGPLFHHNQNRPSSKSDNFYKKSLSFKQKPSSATTY